MMEGLTAADVAAVTNGGGRMNDGMFGGENGWWVIVLLLALGGGRGFGFGGGGVGTVSVCATPADVNAAVDQQTLISKLDQQTYGIADSVFALNNTINNGFFNAAMENQKCCCETQRLLEKNFCDVGNTIHNSTRDIIDNANCNTRAILDFLVKDKIDELKTENQSLRFHASQAEQNNYLLAQLRPSPVPAYITCNPYAASYGFNCGCGGYNGYNG